MEDHDGKPYPHVGTRGGESGSAKASWFYHGIVPVGEEPFFEDNRKSFDEAREFRNKMTNGTPEFDGRVFWYDDWITIPAESWDDIDLNLHFRMMVIDVCNKSEYQIAEAWAVIRKPPVKVK